MIKFYWNPITGLEFWVINPPLLAKTQKSKKRNKRKN